MVDCCAPELRKTLQVLIGAPWLPHLITDVLLLPVEGPPLLSVQSVRRSPVNLERELELPVHGMLKVIFEPGVECWRALSVE